MLPYSDCKRHHSITYNGVYWWTGMNFLLQQTGVYKPWRTFWHLGRGWNTNNGWGKSEQIIIWVSIKSDEIEHTRPRSEDTIATDLKATKISPRQLCPHSAVCCVQFRHFWFTIRYMFTLRSPVLGVILSAPQVSEYPACKCVHLLFALACFIVFKIKMWISNQLKIYFYIWTCCQKIKPDRANGNLSIA